MIFNMFLAFVIAMLTGIIVRNPLNTLVTVGLTGMFGWGANEFTINNGFPQFVAAISGAVVIGIMAEIFAKLQKQPVTVYIVSAIIPLVPGSVAYNSMLAFMDNRFNDGLSLGFKAFLIASYLAAGLAIVPVFIRNIKALFRRPRFLKRH